MAAIDQEAPRPGVATALGSELERIRQLAIPVGFIGVILVALLVGISQNLSGLTADRVLNSLGEVVPVVVALAVGTVALELLVYLFFTRVVVSKNALAYTLLAPSVVGLLAFFAYPFAYDVYLAFTDMKLATLLNPTFSLENGIANFQRVFFRQTEDGLVWGRLLQTADSTFPVILWRTIVWTVVNVTFHVLGGLGLALLLNRKLRFKGVYRTLLVLPWAIPQVIVALTWKSEFNFQYGFVNQMLQSVGLPAVQWLDNPTWAFVAVIIVNVWLGIPFMMVMILGGLQSISDEYYEASEMDGAGKWDQFRHVTLPLLRPVLAPAITLGTIWTFNMVNIIWLITQGGPQEGTNILVTALYNAAFSFNRYGFAAAFSLVCFVILFTFSLFFMRRTGAFGSVYEE